MGTTNQINEFIKYSSAIEYCYPIDYKKKSEDADERIKILLKEIEHYKAMLTSSEKMIVNLTEQLFK